MISNPNHASLRRPGAGGPLLLAVSLGCLALGCLALPRGADAKSTAVTLKTADGLTIAGEWHPPAGTSHGAIIALHMFKSDRSAWKPLIGPATEAGLGVLAIDLRGHGQSRKQKGAKKGQRDLGKRVAARDAALFNAMYQDVEAAAAWLKAEQGIGLDRVALFGASVGCSVALDFGARHPEVRVAVLLTPGKKYLGVDSMKAITRWAGRPVLLVTAFEEAEKGAEALYEATPAPRRSIVMKLPQKNIHGTRMFSKVPRIEKRLVGWALARLQEPPTEPAASPTPPTGGPRIEGTP